MDFAKNLLIKYGWKEGQGIGKNVDGIVEPIKANLKFDKTGLCYDKGVEFTDHWWERAFNCAAENLNVDNSNEAVSLTVKEEKRSFKRSLEMVEMNDHNSKIFKNLTDDDILKACGGRTAHKGARHGLVMSGKLSRIDSQEQQMLEKMAINIDTTQNVFKDWVKISKKKRNKKLVNEIKTTATRSPDSELDYKIRYKSKKKKRQHRHRDEDLAKSFISLSTNHNGDKEAFRVIKKRRSHLERCHEDVSNISESEKNSEFSRKLNEIERLNTMDNLLTDNGEELNEDPLNYRTINKIKKCPAKKLNDVPKNLKLLKKKHLKKSDKKSLKKLSKKLSHMEFDW